MRGEARYWSTFWSRWQVDILSHGMGENILANVLTFWKSWQVNRSTSWAMRGEARYWSKCLLSGAVVDRSESQHFESWHGRKHIVNVSTFWSSWQVSTLSHERGGKIVVNMLTTCSSYQVNILSHGMGWNILVKVSTFKSRWQVTLHTECWLRSCSHTVFHSLHLSGSSVEWMHWLGSVVAGQHVVLFKLQWSLK